MAEFWAVCNYLYFFVSSPLVRPIADFSSADIVSSRLNLEHAVILLFQSSLEAQNTEQGERQGERNRRLRSFENETDGELQMGIYANNESEESAQIY